MTNLVFLDGEYLPQERARISTLDRGFLFGDGVYELIRASGGRLFEPGSHMDRLEAGLHALRIEMNGGPCTTRLVQVAQRLLAENQLLEGEATAYLQVTRGAAQRRHHFPPAGTGPTVLVTTARLHLPLEIRERGAYAVTYPDVRWARCNLKTVNLLPNVLAKQAAVEAGAVEAILVRDGFVTEGSTTNVFGVRDGRLFTHPNCNLILPGITRGVVLCMAAEARLPVTETPLLASELWRLDELFITGTVSDVTAVVRVDGRAVANGLPGPVTRLLQERLAQRIAGGAAGTGGGFEAPVAPVAEPAA